MGGQRHKPLDYRGDVVGCEFWEGESHVPSMSAGLVLISH
jgi:uncharacterized protein YuzE